MTGDVLPSAGAGRWRDLGVRVASAAVLIPAVFLDVWLGAWWFVAFVCVLMPLCAREYVRMICPRHFLQFGLHAAAALAGAVVPAFFGAPEALGLILLFWALSAVEHWRGGRRDGFALLGVAYVGLPGLALTGLREEGGALAIYWLFCVVWLADTMAYFVGRLVGGPKLWPSVSPKKTWAGLAGAVMGAMLASLAVTLGAGLGVVLPLVLAAAPLAVVEQGGDLYESALKRRAGVKDSGTLIPGHGGALDRVDGLLAASMATYLLALSGIMAW